MAETLLSNPVIEDYRTVHVDERSAPSSTASDRRA